MKRCIQLGRMGFPAASPNPAVGCVIECDGQVIGEGYTQAFGGPHAEVMALSSVKNQDVLSKATIYVSLEPCSHYGKTPPCVNRILESGIPRVVVGILDPNPQVAGQGIHRLLEAGRQVHVGVLEEEIRSELRFFLTAQEQKRPYTILKWAQSADGYIAPLTSARSEKAPVWLTNRAARQRVHQYRTEIQSILVGWKTAEDDQAQLTARDWSGPSPRRILIDPQGKTSPHSPIFDQSAPTTLFVNQGMIHAALAPIEVEQIRGSVNELPKQVAGYLHSKQCNSLLVEGGAFTLSTYLHSGQWDEIRLFRSPVELGDGVAAPQFKADFIRQEAIGNNQLEFYKNTQNSFLI